MARRFLLGLDTYSYHFASPVWGSRPPQPLMLDGYLDRAAELGVDGIALADMRHFDSTDERTVAPLRDRAERLGLYVELGTGGVDFDHIRSALQLAGRFGTNVVRTFVSIGRTWRGEDACRQAWPGVVEALRRIAEACEATGVRLAVENHQDLTAPELAELLAAVDHPLVGVCWDTGNSMGVLEDPLEGLRALADRVFTVHFKSYAVLPAAEMGQPAGYVLVGVPPEHSRDMLREMLAMLAARSPIDVLHLNVEAALECIPVTPQRRGWQPRYAQVASRLLGAFAPDRAAARTIRDEWASWAVQKDIPIEKLLALEDQLVRASVRQARELLIHLHPTDAG